MKRITYVILLLVVLILIGLVVFNMRGGQGYLNALVLDIKDESIYVEILEDFSNNGMLTNGNIVTLNSNIVSEDRSVDLKKGDRVRVVYNVDSISEDSSIIEVVFAIYKLEELNNKTKK
mgnify:CR=1 FL=1